MHAGDLGDHIGMESCVDLLSGSEPPFYSGGGGPVNRKPWGTNNRRSSMSSSRIGKELPPPLPVHTSTVMKRYYTGDGRLIITEEKIESPKYQFTAHRSHGRLMIQLIPSDSTNCAAEDDRCSGKVAVDSGGGGDDSDGGSTDGGLEKCFRFNDGVRVAATGPCLFVNQNQLHAIRPVQI